MIFQIYLKKIEEVRKKVYTDALKILKEYMSSLEIFKDKLKVELPLYLILNAEQEERRFIVQEASQLLEKPSVALTPETFTKQSFFQEVSSLQLFSAKSIVILHDIDQLEKEMVEAIVTYLERPNPSVILMMTAGHLPPHHIIIKKVIDLGAVFQSNQEKPWDKEKRLAEWACQVAAASGVRLSLPQAITLVKVVAPEHLKSELEKILTFIGNRDQITAADFAAIGVGYRKESIWKLIDAIFMQEKERALEIGISLLAEGASIFSILAQLRSQILVFQKLIIAQSKGREELQREFSQFKGNLLDLKLRIAMNYGMESFQHALIQLFEIELKAKNSSSDPRLLLGILIFKLSSKYYDTLSFA